jgi:hypothetical protein
MPRFDLLTGKDFSTEARQYGAESLREAGTKDQNATDYRWKEGATLGECRFVFDMVIRSNNLIAAGQVLRLGVATCQSLLQHLSDHVEGSTQYILLDSCPHCAQGDGVRCEAPLAVLSLALPDHSQRDRFPSLRRVYITVSLTRCWFGVMAC